MPLHVPKSLKKLSCIKHKSSDKQNAEKKSRKCFRRKAKDVVPDPSLDIEDITDGDQLVDQNQTSPSIKAVCAPMAAAVMPVVRKMSGAVANLKRSFSAPPSIGRWKRKLKKGFKKVNRASVLMDAFRNELDLDGLSKKTIGRIKKMRRKHKGIAYFGEDSDQPVDEEQKSLINRAFCSPMAEAVMPVVRKMSGAVGKLKRSFSAPPGIGRWKGKLKKSVKKKVSETTALRDALKAELGLEVLSKKKWGVRKRGTRKGIALFEEGRESAESITPNDLPKGVKFATDAIDVHPNPLEKSGTIDGPYETDALVSDLPIIDEGQRDMEPVDVYAYREETAAVSPEDSSSGTASTSKQTSDLEFIVSEPSMEMTIPEESVILSKEATESSDQQQHSSESQTSLTTETTLSTESEVLEATSEMPVIEEAELKESRLQTIIQSPVVQNEADMEIPEHIGEVEAPTLIRQPLSLQQTREPVLQPAREPVPQQIRKPVPQQTREPVPQQTRESVQQQTRKPVPQPTREPVPQLTREPVPQLTREPVPQQTRKPVPQPTREPVPQLTREPVPQPTREPIPQLAREPVPQPTREPVPQLTLEPVPQPTREPVPQLAREPVPQPTREPVQQQTRKPVPQPTREPIPQLAREPVPQPTREPIPQKTREPVPQLAREPVPQPTTDPRIKEERKGGTADVSGDEKSWATKEVSLVDKIISTQGAMVANVYRKEEEKTSPVDMKALKLPRAGDSMAIPKTKNSIEIKIYQQTNIQHSPSKRPKTVADKPQASKRPISQGKTNKRSAVPFLKFLKDNERARSSKPLARKKQVPSAGETKTRHRKGSTSADSFSESQRASRSHHTLSRLSRRPCCQCSQKTRQDVRHCHHPKCTAYSFHGPSMMANRWSREQPGQSCRCQHRRFPPRPVAGGSYCQNPLENKMAVDTITDLVAWDLANALMRQNQRSDSLKWVSSGETSNPSTRSASVMRALMSHLASRGL